MSTVKVVASKVSVFIFLVVFLVLVGSLIVRTQPSHPEMTPAVHADAGPANQ